MVPCLAVLCAALPAAHAADISIETAQEIYYYGDRLTYTVTVSEVTGEPAFLYIVDAGGTKSSAIPLPVSQPVTEFASPFPFEAATYQVGGWTLEIYYGESQSEAAFTLMDSGRAVIPPGSRTPEGCGSPEQARSTTCPQSSTWLTRAYCRLTHRRRQTTAGRQSPNG